MDTVWTVLPFVALLACPVMMAVCFRGMRRTEQAGRSSPEAQAGVQLPEERIAALQQELHAIQAELTALQGRNEHTPAATGSVEQQPVDIVRGTVRAG